AQGRRRPPATTAVHFSATAMVAFDRAPREKFPLTGEDDSRAQGHHVFNVKPRRRAESEPRQQLKLPALPKVHLKRERMRFRPAPLQVQVGGPDLFSALLEELPTREPHPLDKYPAEAGADAQGGEAHRGRRPDEDH
ncbi:unnamed protein product, partial [Prorocentrum cordatum]